jgi:hypothetical protein
MDSYLVDADDDYIDMSRAIDPHLNAPPSSDQLALFSEVGGDGEAG